VIDVNINTLNVTKHQRKQQRDLAIDLLFSPRTPQTAQNNEAHSMDLLQVWIQMNILLRDQLALL
jgi:hypothetical protein